MAYFVTKNLDHLQWVANEYGLDADRLDFMDRPLGNHSLQSALDGKKKLLDVAKALWELQLISKVYGLNQFKNMIGELFSKKPYHNFSNLILSYDVNTESAMQQSKPENVERAFAFDMHPQALLLYESLQYAFGKRKKPHPFVTEMTRVAKMEHPSLDDIIRHKDPQFAHSLLRAVCNATAWVSDATDQSYATFIMKKGFLVAKEERKWFIDLIYNVAKPFKNESSVSGIHPRGIDHRAKEFLETIRGYFDFQNQHEYLLNTVPSFQNISWSV